MRLRILIWIILFALLAVLWAPAKLNLQAVLWLSGLSLCAIVSVWFGVTVIFLGIFAVVSVDDFGDLLSASFRAAAPAMWFVPGALLASSANLLHRTAGCLLAANAVRMLLSQGAPRKLIATTATAEAKKGPSLLFRTAPASGSAVAATILGACLLQLAMYQFLSRRSTAGVALLCLGTAVWTYAALVRGVWKPKPSADTRLVLGDVWMTLLLTALLSAIQVGNGIAESRGLLAAARQGVQLIPAAALPDLDAVNRAKKPGKRPEQARVMPLVGGVPGVIFRPDTQVRQTSKVGYPSGTQVSFLRSVSFQFTGEYYVFPTANGHIDQISEVLKGTPLDSRYQSLTGGTVETEAYQKLNPPLELSACRAVEMTISSAETTPASASMQLVINGRIQDLGMEIFGLERAGSEKLTFPVPPMPRDQKVEALRIVFNRDPSARFQTVKVAIQSFTLLART